MLWVVMKRDRAEQAAYQRVATQIAAGCERGGSSRHSPDVPVDTPASRTGTSAQGTGRCPPVPGPPDYPASS